ncbi:MAG: DUF3817 domain-containing protein [Patulibacter sp.]|nr:DUF3817 domain-containing protein [Patulibacter sp.]
MFDVATTNAAQTQKRLKIVAVLAAVDVILLVALLIGYLDIVNSDSYRPIVGPIHGATFMVLAAVTGWGMLEKRWNWKFPALVIGANVILFGGLKAVGGLDDPSIALLIPVVAILLVFIVTPLATEMKVSAELRAKVGA